MVAESIYEVPILIQKQGLDTVVLKKLNLLNSQKPKLKEWNDFLNNLKNPTQEVDIAIIGKYVELVDSYKSIAEAFIHAGAFTKTKVNITWIHSQDINAENVSRKLSNFHGVLVAPGFGSRDIEGKIITIEFVRKQRIPFFGICLGMQCLIIEFARNVLKLADVDSEEMNPKTKNPIICLMENQKGVKKLGATLRKGAYSCELKKGFIPEKSYKAKSISERHRHRFEFNNKYLSIVEKNGLKAVGINKKNNLVEIMELEGHPWFLGVQFHPEYKSTVIAPHPLFISFVKAMNTFKKNKK